MELRLSRSRSRRLLLLAAIGSAGAGMAGCGGGKPGGPSVVCASDATAAEIRRVVFARAQSVAENPVRGALAAIARETRVSLKNPLLDSYDRDTRKTSCSATLHVYLPVGVLSPVRTPADLSAAVHYSSQPLADGSGVHFELSDVSELVSGVARADVSRWAELHAPPASPAAPERLVVTTAAAGPPNTSTAPARPAPAEPARPVVPAAKLARAEPASGPSPEPPPELAGAPVARPPPQARPAVKAAPSLARAGPPPPAARPPAVQAAAARSPARRPAPAPQMARAAPPPPRLTRPAPPRLARAAPAPPPDFGAAPTRVFIHIAGPDQIDEAEAVRGELRHLRLNGASVATPAIRIVRSVPGRSQVRCLRASDCAAARQVAASLGDMLPDGTPVVVDMHRTYQTDPNVRPGTLEVWLRPERGPFER